MPLSLPGEMKSVSHNPYLLPAATSAADTREQNSLPVKKTSMASGLRHRRQEIADVNQYNT
jgi:hypothetical protein